jgi:hypothetical protein
MSQGSDKVVSLAAFRAVRAARQPARPFLMWYPGVGYVRSDAGLTVTGRGVRQAPAQR